MLLREIYYFCKVMSQHFYSYVKKKKLQSFFLSNLFSDHNVKKYYSYKKNLLEYPIQTKKSLLKKFFYFEENSFYFVSRTSGTSGVQLKIIFDDEAIDYLNCIFSRTLLINGYNPFCKLGFYWYRQENNSSFNKLGISQKCYIKNDDSSKKIYRILIHKNIKFIYIFPFKLLEFINNLSTLELKKLNLKCVFLTGEISTPKMKNYFSDKLQCNIIDIYATCEFNIIAYKNNRSFYKINYDSVFLEYKKSKIIFNNNNLYFPVVTGLVNKTMPILRYKLDDLVSLHDGTIKNIYGRKDYFFKIGDLLIYLGDIIDILLDYQEIILFNFIFITNQKSIVINLVIKKNVNKLSLSRKLKKKLFQKYGINSFSLIYKSHLEFLNRGKLKLLVVK